MYRIMASVSALLLAGASSHKSATEPEESIPNIRPNFTTVNTNPT